MAYVGRGILCGVLSSFLSEGCGCRRCRGSRCFPSRRTIRYRAVLATHRHGRSYLCWVRLGAYPPFIVPFFSPLAARAAASCRHVLSCMSLRCCPFEHSKDCFVASSAARSPRYCTGIWVSQWPYCFGRCILRHGSMLSPKEGVAPPCMLLDGIPYRYYRGFVTYSLTGTLSLRYTWRCASWRCASFVCLFSPARVMTAFWNGIDTIYTFLWVFCVPVIDLLL